MKRVCRLIFFAVLVSLVSLGAFSLIRYNSRLLYEQKLAEMQKMQQAQLALVIVTFHSYYHVWPGEPGPLDSAVLIELRGYDTAKINTQHIDFLKKYHFIGDLNDNHGRPLTFKTDDSLGICSVSENEASHAGEMPTQ